MSRYGIDVEKYGARITNEGGKELATVSRDYLETLLADQSHYSKLDSLGVDNWGSYVGFYRSCDECGYDRNTWANDVCAQCDEELTEDDEEWY